MNELTTKGALATIGMDALDRNRVDKVAVSAIAGGVSFASALEVMEFSKLMSLSQQAVPPAFRNNPGLCLAVTFQAVEWRMSPFQVANKAYVVNDRLAFESQLIHAVIEARAPLKGRLRCDYIGEGADLQCKVYGTFEGEEEPHEYTSPKFSAITTKNSPLWKTDPQQQLFYFSSRSWARKWAPDVLLGIYSREEIEEMEPPTPSGSGLHARLAGSERQIEGHQEGHAATELDQIGTNGKAAEALKEAAPAQSELLAEEQASHAAGAPAPEESAKPESAPEKPKPKKADKIETGKQPSPLDDIKTPDDYEVHANTWIDAATDVELARAQWSRERTKRTELGVMEDMLIRINKRYNDKIKELQRKAAA